MRRVQNADTHALKQHRLSQNISPVSAPVLYWLPYLTHISSLKAKNVDLHTAKNIQIQPIFFPLFLDELLETDLRPIYCCLNVDSSLVKIVDLTAAASVRQFEPSRGRTRTDLEKNGHLGPPGNGDLAIQPSRRYTLLLNTWG